MKLIRTLIRANKGKVVLDPFMGSGTTALACIQCERDFIGIEIEPKYIVIANKRIEQKPLQWATLA